MIYKKLVRFYFIIHVFFSYRLDKIIPYIYTSFLLRFSRIILFWIPNLHKDLTISERLLLALQQMGPIWIKFGQIISMRRDLFSKKITKKLYLLQDRVPYFDGVFIRKNIELSMGGSIEEWFDYFEPNALASASIAQVHTAYLKTNGKEVIVKIIRPDICSIIKKDICIMYFIANWIPKILPYGNILQTQEVVREYEKNLFYELNLLREAENGIKLRNNFSHSSVLYIPKIYYEYCSEKVLVMERIYGIPVSDITKIKKNGTNMKILAERGVQIFFSQVFRDSFFHADMHPGNIFISYNFPESPCYIAIDYGMIGSLNKKYKKYIAENLIAFFHYNYRKVAELHIHSGWVHSNTHIDDFESAISTVFHDCFKKSISEISFGKILFHLFNIVSNFHIKVQPQLILLQKTLLYIEVLGKKIYPPLDLWKTAQPFLENWLYDHTGIPAIIFLMK